MSRSASTTTTPVTTFPAQTAARTREPNADKASAFARMLSAYGDRRAVSMLFLGFASGIPLALIFGTLSLWLTEAGIERKAVTMFSWAALGYSFRFIWAPMIDSLPLPVLTKWLGRRRAWLLLAQSMVIAALLLMSSLNPADAAVLNLMAAAAVMLGFSAATQDIVIDAYRIERAPADAAAQSVMSSTYVTGYRLGMVLSGGGSLFLAEYFGSTPKEYVYSAWQYTYMIMAVAMGVGVLTTLCVREPERPQGAETKAHQGSDNLRLVLLFALAVTAFVLVFRQMGEWLPSSKDALTAFGLEALRLTASAAAAVVAGYAGMAWGIVPAQVAKRTWITPLTDFFKRYGKRALLLLALVGLYRISDIVAGVISLVFYADLGFSKEQIGAAVKSFGVIMSIVGGLAGGMLAQRLPVMKMMMFGAVMAAATNLLFILLAQNGGNVAMLYWVVGFDNFAAGLASTVFVAFLSALTNIRFSAVQYALFSSLMNLFPKVLGGYSGGMVDAMGYEGFFAFTAALTLPVLLLVWLVNKKIFAKQ